MSDRRRTGKIAQLPRDLRNEVNRQLRDGVQYGAIIAFLRNKGVPGVNTENMSHWYKGSGDPSQGSGYQDWLGEQARLDDMKVKREFALQVVQENQGSEVHEAAVQIAASHLYEIFNDFDPESFREKLKTNPKLLAPLMNSAAKLFGENVKFQRYKDEVAQRKERIQQELAAAKGKGGITKETIQRIEQELNLL